MSDASTSSEKWAAYWRQVQRDNECDECGEKDAEILRLREENRALSEEVRACRSDVRKLREAVIKERAVMSMMRRECVHAYDGVQPNKDCLDNAERELRAEGVIE